MDGAAGLASGTRASGQGGVMPSEDASDRVKKRVDRLVSQAVAELKSRGIETKGKPPRQIFRMANAARRAAVVPKKKAT
jgi:hypothetical protein